MTWKDGWKQITFCILLLFSLVWRNFYDTEIPHGLKFVKNCWSDWPSERGTTADMVCFPKQFFHQIQLARKKLPRDLLWLKF